MLTCFEHQKCVFGRKLFHCLSRTYFKSLYLFKSHYETLGVSTSASIKDIKSAYIKLSKQNHPDLHPNDKACHDQFLKVQEAYETLSNPITKRQYDNTLGRKSPYGSYPGVQKPHTPYSHPQSSTQWNSYSKKGYYEDQKQYYDPWEAYNAYHKKAREQQDAEKRHTNKSGPLKRSGPDSIVLGILTIVMICSVLTSRRRQSYVAEYEAARQVDRKIYYRSSGHGPGRPFNQYVQEEPKGETSDV